jgi:hypothetical protein
METPKQVLCGIVSMFAAGFGSVAITMGLVLLWPEPIYENIVLIMLGLFVVLWWVFYLAFAVFGIRN